MNPTHPAQIIASASAPSTPPKYPEAGYPGIDYPDFDCLVTVPEIAFLISAEALMIELYLCPLYERYGGSEGDRLVMIRVR